VKDFTPISSMGYFDFLFCVNASSSFQSMADFVKTAREKAGDAQYRHNQHRQQPESYC
jgi:tripartite-type tricarboxylate transporter receptor subunit TctC